MASVLVETGEMLDAIKEKIGFTEMVCIPADVARVNGLRKKEYSVFYNKDYAGKDGDSYPWSLRMAKWKRIH